MAHHYQWKWERNGELSKLLGIAFGLSLDVQDVHEVDVDEFLISKIQKKIMYEGSKHLSLTNERIIVNHVLALTLWFFVLV